MTDPIVDVIFGGQFGSEGKRLFNEFYAYKTNPTAIVSNFGPNSGGFVSDGEKWATFAAGIDCLHMISPGSIISLEDFRREKANLPKGATIVIHENACVVMPWHLKKEERFVSIGSTMTGTAAAVLEKMERKTSLTNVAGQIPELRDYTVNARNWFNILSSQKRIQLSVPQGHSLSLNHGFFPYCTSRNTSPQQALADAGIPINWVDKIIACMRTFPIRVANRFNDKGVMIGTSGPCYNDQYEMTWEEVGQKPEITSVSKKVRRVFSFSMLQYLESCRMNGVTDVFLNFCNYLTKEKMEDLFIKLSTVGPKISWCGYGPTMSDIATVKQIISYDSIDEREGCHPTMFQMGVDNEQE